MKRRAARLANATSTGAGLVLDAGALLALERRHIRLLADLKRAGELGLPIRVPAGALAQAWRGGSRSASIARLLQHATTVRVDEASAKEVGVFLAHLQLPESEKPDVVDAHVALVARATQSLVWTSDPSDMARYGVETKLVRKL